MNPDAPAIIAAIRHAIPAGLVSVYLFGSHAEGRAHRDSDLDVGVLLDPRRYGSRKDRFEARIAASARLGATRQRPVVDVVVLNDAPPHLVRRIMTEGRRLWCADAEADHAARLTALSRAADLEPFLRRMRAIKLDALVR